MPTPRFLTLLALVTLVAAIGVAACHLLLNLDYALGFSIGTAVLFIAICTALFFLGRRSAGAENKMLFSNVFLGATLVKMLVCGMLVVGYAILGEPESKLFIVPFFWLYGVYTAFEVYFLMRLSATVSP
jgi:F0F1-type ATP synthase assembly protein I